MLMWKLLFLEVKKHILLFLMVFWPYFIQAQSISWFSSIDFGQREFFNNKIIALNDGSTLLVGLVARTSSTLSTDSNAIYIKKIDEQGNLIWNSIYFPADSIKIFSINIYDVKASDSMVIVLGSYSHPDSVDNILFYSRINLNRNKIDNLYLGRSNQYSIADFELENKFLIILNQVQLNTLVVERTNIITLQKFEKTIQLKAGLKKYYKNRIYVVTDSIGVNDEILQNVSKYSLDGNLLSDNSYQNNLYRLKSGLNSYKVFVKKDLLAITGTYDYHINNPNINGIEKDCYVSIIDTSTLLQKSFFSLNQNSLKVIGCHTLNFDFENNYLLSNVRYIDNNNVNRVKSYFVNGNITLWSKILVDSVTSNTTPSFYGVNILKSNFIQMLSFINKNNVSFLNSNIVGGEVESANYILHDSSQFVRITNGVSTLNNDLYYCGIHKLKNKNHNELFLTKIDYLKTGIGFKPVQRNFIYPNPTVDFINIDIEDEIVSVEVLDMLGVKIKEGINTKYLSLLGMNAGLYVVKIRTSKNEVYFEKLLIH